VTESNPGAGDQLRALASAFTHANASLALEGLVVDAAQAGRQQRVIEGELTIAAAIEQANDAASRISAG